MNDAGIALVTLSGLIIGISLWIWLVYWDKSSAISFGKLFSVLLITGLMCRLAFSLFNSSFNAPDEQSHFKYIRYLYEEHSFPIQTSITNAPTNDWEYYQPPLYYMMLVPVYGVSGELFGEGHAVVVTLRCVSILLWLVTVFLALKIIDRIGVQDIFSRAFTMGMMCLLPTYTFLSGAINNDNLLFALGGGILYLLTRKPSFYNSLGIGLLCGAALLTKSTGIVFLFAIAAMLVMRWATKSLPLSKMLGYLVLIFIIAVGIWTPWAVRNFHLYGDVIGHSVAGIPAKWSSIFSALRYTQHCIKGSFWSASGIYGEVSFLQTIGVHISYFAVVGLAIGLWSKSRPIRNCFTGFGMNFMIAMALTISFNLALVIIFGIKYSQGQGRFLFPMLIPISLLTATGIKLLRIEVIPRAHIHFVGFFITYILSFATYSFTIFAQR